MQRRYGETESGAVREELAKFQSTQPCETCKGKRLNVAARNVFVQDKPLPEIASLSVVAALEFFAGLRLKGWRAEIADKIVKEIHNRLKFLATWGSATCRSTAAPTRCAAAKRSAFGSRARSARGSSA